jgi:hypothetical protein
MLDQFLELIKSSLPEALGGIIAAAILAAVGGIWAYTRRHAKRTGTEDTLHSGSEVHITGVGFDVEPDEKVDTSLYKGKSGALGALQAKLAGKLSGGIYFNRAYTHGEGLRMEAPGGTMVELGTGTVRGDTERVKAIDGITSRISSQEPKIDQYLERSSWISSTRRNELRIGSDFLLWDQCTLMLWVLVPPLGAGLRDAPHYRYLVAHHTGDAEDLQNYNAFALRYTPDHHWEVVFSNNKAQYAAEALRIDDRLEPGWHHFLITWDRLKPELLFLIDRGRRGGNRSEIFLAYWPERLSENAVLGAWMPAYEESYCDTKLWHVWICDRYVRPTDPIAEGHFRLVVRQ